MICLTENLSNTHQLQHEQVINQEWHIALCKHRAAPLFEKLAVSPLHKAELLTIISELGYNLFFHAYAGGVIKISTCAKFNSQGIVIESIDSGPGIHSLTLCMQDGYSTKGGLGGGLPGIKRLSDDFKITQLNHGTWVRCVKWFS